MTNATCKWLVLSSMVIGCGGGTVPAPAARTAKEAKPPADSGPMNAVSKRGSGTVSALFGPGGGTLELDEGPRVVVPAGAIKGGQEFVLKIAAKTTAFSNKESEKALGPTFSFAPGVDAPDGSGIEVSFPLASLPPGWGEPSIAHEAEYGETMNYGEDSTRTKWFYDRAQLSGGRVVATLATLDGLRMNFVLTNLEAQ